MVQMRSAEQLATVGAVQGAVVLGTEGVEQEALAVARAARAEGLGTVAGVMVKVGAVDWAADRAKVEAGHQAKVVMVVGRGGVMAEEETEARERVVALDLATSALVRVAETVAEGWGEEGRVMGSVAKLADRVAKRAI